MCRLKSRVKSLDLLHDGKTPADIWKDYIVAKKQTGKMQKGPEPESGCEGTGINGNRVRKGLNSMEYTSPPIEV